MSAAKEAILRNIAEVSCDRKSAATTAARSRRCWSPRRRRLAARRSPDPSYAPGAHVLRHSHDAKEQIYHFLEGEGLLELGDKKHVVRSADYAFIPPHVPHALENTGLQRLVFMVITIPVTV